MAASLIIFLLKKTTDLPKNASKICKRDYYIKRYKGLIKNILTKREDDKLHTYALSIITSNYIDYYSFYNSAYFEDAYYLRDQSIAKQELYEKLERLITVYQGRVSKKQPQNLIYPGSQITSSFI